MEMVTLSQDKHGFSKYLQYISAGAAFLIPLLQIMRLPFSLLTGLPMQSFAFLPIVILAIIGFYFGCKTKDLKRTIKYSWLFLTWVVYVAITTIWSSNRYMGLMFLGTLFCGYLCIWIFKNESMKERVFQGYLTGITVMNLFITYIYINNNFDYIKVFYTRFAYMFITAATGTAMIDPNAWAGYQILAIVILFIWIDRDGADFKSYMLAVYNIWMLWLTNSNGTLMALFAMLCLSYLLLKRRYEFLNITIMFILMLAISIVFPLVMHQFVEKEEIKQGEMQGGIQSETQELIITPPPVFREFETFIDPNGRMFIWQSSIQEFIKYPLQLIFGLGNGSADDFTGKAINETVLADKDSKKNQIASERPVSPHNTYINFLFEYGVIGFSLWCIFFFNMIFVLWKHDRSIILYCIPFVVGGLTVTIHTRPPFILALSVMLAHFIHYKDRLEKKKISC